MGQLAHDIQGILGLERIYRDLIGALIHLVAPNECRKINH